VKFRSLTALLAVSAACALSACGGSSSAGSSSSAGGSTDPAGGASRSPLSQSAGAHTGSSPTKGTDVCADLPAAAVSHVTGTRFTTAKSSSVQGLIFNCEYDGPGSALLQISVQTQDGKQGFDSDVSALKAVQHPPALVSGVGDEAFSEPNPRGNAGSAGASAFASYGAVFGDTYIQIGGLTYVTADQGKQIAEQLHGKF
jgi:hypothetical protein